MRSNPLPEPGAVQVAIAELQGLQPHGFSAGGAGGLPQGTGPKSFLAAGARRRLLLLLPPDQSGSPQRLTRAKEAAETRSSSQSPAWDPAANEQQREYGKEGAKQLAAANRALPGKASRPPCSWSRRRQGQRAGCSGKSQSPDPALAGKENGGDRSRGAAPAEPSQSQTERQLRPKEPKPAFLELPPKAGLLFHLGRPASHYSQWRPSPRRAFPWRLLPGSRSSHAPVGEARKGPLEAEAASCLTLFSVAGTALISSKEKEPRGTFGKYAGISFHGPERASRVSSVGGEQRETVVNSGKKRGNVCGISCHISCGLRSLAF